MFDFLNNKEEVKFIKNNKNNFIEKMEIIISKY